MNDTIVWQSENDIVVPVTVQQTEAVATPAVTKVSERMKTGQTAPTPHVQYGVPPLLAYPYSVVTDTIATDTVAADTIVTLPGEIMGGIILENPASRYNGQTETLSHPFRNNFTGHFADGMSWIYLAMTILFCAIGIKFKGNSRYLKALLSDLTDIRLRHNAFDETVRETSLLVILNMMWTLNVGIMLWELVRVTATPALGNSFSVPDAGSRGILLCTGVATAYLVVMLLAYWIVGNVFSDRKKTRMWVKGAAASTALETFLFIPVSLLALVYPQWCITLLFVAGFLLLTGKIVFLYKGFRIFFSEISSWLLFLYYLCSLEIVPLILAYLGAVAACGTWL